MSECRLRSSVVATTEPILTTPRDRLVWRAQCLHKHMVALFKCTESNDNFSTNIITSRNKINSERSKGSLNVTLVILTIRWCLLFCPSVYLWFNQAKATEPISKKVCTNLYFYHYRYSIIKQPYLHRFRQNTKTKTNRSGGGKMAYLPEQ